MDKLGKFTNLERVGKGAMGVVYRATDETLGTVAIKIIAGDLRNDPHQRERFIREARVAASLTHPNIIDIHGMGEHEGRPYIVMEFLEGQSLKAVINRAHEFPLEDRLELMRQVADALAYAHRADIAHRDIKPENIFVTRDGTVRILDFGVARIKDSTMTATGVVLGTPSYMSPEQVMGKKVDRRSDIFSAGTVFYELLTGTRAFPGRVDEVFEKITQLEPPPIHRLDEIMPKELSAMVHKAMAKAPDQRYQSMDEFLTHLRLFENSLPRLCEKARAQARAAIARIGDELPADGLLATGAVARTTLPDTYLEIHKVIRRLSQNRDQVDLLIDEMQWVAEVSAAPLDEYGQETLRTMANRVDEIRDLWPSEPSAAQLGRRLLDELRARLSPARGGVSDPSTSSTGSGDFALSS